MTWNRRVSKLEAMTVEILKRSEKPLTLRELVDAVNDVSPDSFTGKTPTNSLYSILYRSQKRRLESGQSPIFDVLKVKNKIYFKTVE